jgi:hypothetical protein
MALNLTWKIIALILFVDVTINAILANNYLLMYVGDYSMNTNRMIRIIAGCFVLLSLALGVEASPIFHHVTWLWFTAFVGANLLQSGFTNWCLMEVILKKLGVPTECAQRSNANFLLDNRG